MEKLLPGWFGDLTPNKQKIQNEIKKIIEKNYEIFWYVNIETPSVELNTVLTSKWWDEVSKQIFWLYGLKQWASDLKDFSLRFDLTVPLARYVVDNEASIKFPFKRYQIQRVFRWERQQKGRFKEFTQCDIDVIGNNLPLNYDAEVISTLYTTLKEIFWFLEIPKDIEVRLNNKKFIEWICLKYSLMWEKKRNFYQLLDGFYKSTKQEFNTDLQSLVGKDFQSISALLDGNIQNLSDTDEYMWTWIQELKQVYTKLSQKWVNVIFDPYITRWLDYYTGTVFETFVSGYINFWSVCSGGRYDNLVDAIRKVKKSKWPNYQWVWGSIGLSRLFSRLEDEWFITKTLPLTQVILFNTPTSNEAYIENIAQLLRNNDISTDIYYGNDKLSKQLTYAQSKNILFWIFAGKDEQDTNDIIVKNLEQRIQEQISLWDMVNYIKNIS